MGVESGKPERDEAGRELRALRGMIDAATSSLSWVDLDLRLVAANRRRREALGLPEDSASGTSLREILPKERFEREEPFLRRALAGEELAFHGPSPDGKRLEEVRCLPAIGSDGKVEGLVELRTEVGGASDPTGDLLRRLSETERALARREAELSRLSTVDPLCGVLNRGAILAYLESEVHRAARYERPLALVLFDLDRFKLVNDIQGPAAGDKVICRLAELCLEAFRATDRIGRYGGEEFLAILPEVGKEGAMIAAERVRAGMAAERFSLPREGDGGTGEFTVTVSAGVATFEKGMDADRLLACLDAALYRAKEKGRNRVELHGRH